MEGRSHWKALTGSEEPAGYERVISCESTWQAKWAVRTNDAKFILAREPDRHGMPPRELYDLTADPGEILNVAEARREQVAEMEAGLEAWIAAGLARMGRSEDPLRAQGITLGKRWNR